MDLCLNTVLILEYYTQQRKKCTIYCKFFFSFPAIHGVSVKNQLVLFTLKDLYFIFILGGGGEWGGKESHVPRPREELAYCNKIECNKSYKSSECIDSLESYID